MQRVLFLILIFAVLATCKVYGQVNNNSSQKLQDLGINRIITTAVPFLNLAPDARSGALADAGVATSPDANAMHWNAAKLAFMEKDLGFSLSYNPWLRKLVNDMSLNYLAGYKKLSKQEAIGIQLLYFDLGEIQFTDENGNNLNKYTPKEFSMGLAYSRKLSEKLGVSLGLKFIHSNLAGNFAFKNGQQTKPGNSAAGDIGVFYTSDVLLGGKAGTLNFGANISNIGAKMTYSNASNKEFIPTNLRLGTAFTTELDPFNKITFILEVSKLLVPTPPVYYKDQFGNPTDSIEKGNDPATIPFVRGMFSSFADAPGGAKEELQEVIFHGGIEYWYYNTSGEPLFAVRGGYFHENKFKGNRKYFTLGFGVHYQAFGIDFAYLVPLKQDNPLAESLRFTLAFDIQTKKVQESITE